MLEIVVRNAPDAVAARKGGATQLLQARYSGSWMTPGVDVIKSVCAETSLDVLVLIRPPGHSFVYSPTEIAGMCLDIRAAREAGAKGFVLGCLTPDGRIDVAALEAFQTAAEACPIGFHFGWEQARNLSEALDTMLDAGVTSIRLTGGRDLTAKAIDGIAAIRELAEQGGNRAEFFLTGGVNAENVGQIVKGTRIRNAHAGSSVRTPPAPVGAVDAGKVRQLAEALRRATQALDEPGLGAEATPQ